MYILNNMSFIFLSWAEIFGFAMLYWLIRDIRNELNMKREVQVVLITWTFFSMLYFILNLVNESLYIQEIQEIYKTSDIFYNYSTSTSMKFHHANAIMIFTVIQLRNMSALFATTLFSIHMLWQHPDKVYPRMLEGKLLALDLEMILESQIPFKYFYEFIKDHSTKNLVYLDVYVKIKLYTDQGNKIINLIDGHKNKSFSKACNESNL